MIKCNEWQGQLGIAVITILIYSMRDRISNHACKKLILLRSKKG
jgi:hypothetical protein